MPNKTIYLKAIKEIEENAGFSFIFDAGNNPLLGLLYSIIPVPYFYLTPLIPFMYLFFLLLARLFKKYPTGDLSTNKKD